METNRLEPGPSCELANAVARDLLQAIGKRLQQAPPPNQATWYDVDEICVLTADLGDILRRMTVDVMEGD